MDVNKNYHTGLARFRDRCRQSSGKVADLRQIAAEMSVHFENFAELDGALAIFYAGGLLRALDQNSTLSPREFDCIISRALIELTDSGQEAREVLEQRHALAQRCKAEVGTLSELVEQVFAGTADKGICRHTLALMIEGHCHYRALAARLEEFHETNVAAKQH